MTYEYIFEKEINEFVSRIEASTQQRDHVNDRLRRIYKEAHNRGLNTAILRRIVSLKKMDQDDLYGLESTEALYKKAVGLNSIPLQTDMFEDMEAA